MRLLVISIVLSGLTNFNFLFAQEKTQVSVDFEYHISPEEHGYTDASGFYIYQLELGQKFGLNLNIAKRHTISYQNIFVASIERYYSPQTFSLNSLQYGFRFKLPAQNYLGRIVFSILPTVAKGQYCFSDFYSHCTTIDRYFFGIGNKLKYPLSYRWYIHGELNYLRSLYDKRNNTISDNINWFWFGVGYTPFYRLDKTR